MRYTLKTIIPALFISFFAINPAMAELFINPTEKSAVGEKRVTGFFATSSVGYKNDVGTTGDVDRTFIGASVGFGATPKVDIFGTFSIILESELETFPSDGDGFAIAFGARGKLPVKASFDVHGYAQYLIIDEDYGTSGGGSLSGDGTNISFGAMASTMSSNVKFYGGVEFILSSKLDFKPGGGNAKYDDKLGFRLGAEMASGDIDLNFAIALAHESGFLISASKKF